MANVLTNNSNNILTSARSGAIICNTPKSIVPVALISNTSDLINTFGDPFIQPDKYADLIIAYRLINSGISLYISSLDDMKHNNNDGFKVSYNGYTEFIFRSAQKDSNNNVKFYDSVGYKLKSDIKFCQPIIHTRKSYNSLYVYVTLYLLDNSIETLKSFKSVSIYRTITILLDITRDSDGNLPIDDQYLIDQLSTYGLELQVINADPYKSTSLLDELIAHSNPSINVIYNTSKNELYYNGINKDDENDWIVSQEYRYNLHYNNYKYNINDILTIVDIYKKAIENYSSVTSMPFLLCIGKLYKSINSDYIANLDPDLYIYIHTLLMYYFGEDNDTYLLMNMPDVSISTALDLLNGNYGTDAVPSQYNADLYYGYVSELITSSLFNNDAVSVSYPVSLLSFYNLLVNNTQYLSNNVANLNIPNSSIKSIISESSANQLASLRCNSLVLFDTGYPSIYGNRSLSLLPNLRYSHIARNVIFLRRTIKEYLETKKFIINTLFSIDACISYISNKILNEYVNTVISNYDISYSISNKTVNIQITLYFLPATINNFTLNFNI